MKKIVIASLLVVGAIAIFFTFTFNRVKKKTVAKSSFPVQNIEKDSSFKDEKDKVVNLSKSNKKEQTNNQRELVIKENNLEEELEDLHKEYSFEPISTAEVSQDFPPKKFVKPVGAISMPKEEFENLHVGNKINFVDIEGMNYSLELKGVEPMDGSNSFFGEVESSDGMHYQTIVTVGEDGSGYIHLATSKGVYEIELKNGKGYVYRSSDIQKGMGDEKEDDFLVKKFNKNMENQ